MLIFYFIILLLSLYKLSLCHGCYDKNYLTKDKANVVKGISILMIFVSHSLQYITDSGYVFSSIGDSTFLFIRSWHGQLVVVMFLFFSGYGIMESYKKKGEAYVATMPRKRIFTTLLNFDVAVLFFIVLNLLLGKTMSLRHILLSFLAWDSVGNSNWYIFCILVCYLLSFLVLSLYVIFFRSKSVYIYALSPIFILSIITIIVLSYLKAPYWYNTMMCFPFGMLFSVVQEKIDAIVQHHYYKSVAAFFILFLVFRYIPISMKGLIYNMESIAFAMIIVFLMMKVESENKWLRWMGQNIFPLYIYQRLSMMAIYEMPGGKDFIASFPILYIVICFICTLFITSQYHRWQIKLL